MEAALKKKGRQDIRWSEQGMLRLSPELMRSFFEPSIAGISRTIDAILDVPECRGSLRTDFSDHTSLLYSI